MKEGDIYKGCRDVEEGQWSASLSSPITSDGSFETRGNMNESSGVCIYYSPFYTDYLIRASQIIPLKHQYGNEASTAKRCDCAITPWSSDVLWWSRAAIMFSCGLQCCNRNRLTDAHLSIYSLSICLSSVCLSTYLSTCLSIIYLSSINLLSITYLSIYVAIDRSNYLAI